MNDLPRRVVLYHWWELPQVLFLLRQKLCHGKHVFVMTKIFVATNDKNTLLWQNCRDKTFVAAKRHALSRQNFCHDKNYACASSRQWQYFVLLVLTASFVVIKRHVLSRQNFCHNCEQVLFVYVSTLIPPCLTDQCNFITVLIVTREPEQMTLLFWSAACGITPTELTPHDLHTADRR